MKPKSNLRIACWLTDKKIQKFNWQEFQSVCMKHGYELFNVDPNSSLNCQGPFHVFLHKLTEIIASAEQGDVQNSEKIRNIEDYLTQYPSIIVIDPIPNVRQLLDRYVSYRIIRSTDLYCNGIFTPNFCDLRSENSSEISQALKSANVTYPFICKPILGHGSKQAHEMSIIFNDKQLSKCKIPCVAQSFINHNAVLYKLFILGSKHYCVQRPSIKNFHTTDLDVITFQTSDVSKAGSQNDLCILDPEDENYIKVEPDPMIFDLIAKRVRREFGMDLLGVDVVISNLTSRYAIIDVNAFPSYDGFPNFFESLLGCIEERSCDNMNNVFEKMQTDVKITNNT